MNKREAKRLADSDTTEYGVLSRGKLLSLITVTGYRNAKIVAREGDLILTRSEVEQLRGGERMDIIWS